MSKKILVEDYPSFVESKLLPDVESTFNSTDSDIIVNPKYDDYINKDIIVNLPCECDLQLLSKNNTVVSRFPISPEIPVIPYKLPDSRKSIKAEDYSCLILTQSLLEDLDKKLDTINKNFLVGIGTVLDGDATLVGLELCKTNIESIDVDDL